MLVKKTTRLRYSGSWGGNIKLSKQGHQIASRTGYPDYDIHILNADSGYYDVEINSIQHGEGKIKICSTLDTLNLGQWKLGDIVRPYGSDWMQVEVPAGQDTLYIQTEGYGVWSTIDFYRDVLGSASNHWRFDNMGAGYQIKGKIINSPAGRYFIRYMDSAVLQGGATQTRQYMIFADAHQITQSPPIHPIITKLSTYKCGKIGPARVTILGAGFDSAATVSLVRSGLENVLPSSLFVDTFGRTITTTFDLSGVASGEWTVKVMNPDRDSAICPIPLIVEDGGVVDLWVDIVGREMIRVGRKQTYVVNYGNRGNVNAIVVPIWIGGIPSGANFNFRTSIASPLDLGFDTLDYSGIPIGIKDSTGVTVPIFVSHIPPGFTGSIEFSIAIPERLNLTEFAIKAWISTPLITNENSLTCNKITETNYVSSGGVNLPCVGAIVDMSLNALGFVPGVKCGAAVTAYMVDKFVALGNFAHDPTITSGVLFGAGQMAGGIGLVPACGTSVPGLNFIAAAVGTSLALPGVWNKCWPKPKEKEKKVSTGSATTPEDKYGPKGYDLKGTVLSERRWFTKTNDEYKYRVDFWNKEDAPVPAQEVFILDTLDSNFDLTTLNFTEVGFLRWTVKLEGGQYFNTNVDMRPDMNLIVNVEGKLNVDSRVINWTFRSLDPTTMELPEDPMAGFLPPIDSTGYQIGWVNFTLRPNAGLPSGTKITNQAFVNFDGVGPWNPAPKEAPFLNTIDAVAPSSKIDSLPSVVNDTTVTLRFLGWDDLLGSGVVSYSVYVSVDSGPFALWRTYVKDTSVQFTGIDGHRYAFYSIAHDGVGNSEAMKSSPDAQTVITISTGVPFEQGLPNEYALRQNYPNPFNPITTFEYQLPQISRVYLRIYNILGQEVKTLVDEIQEAGFKSVEWNSTNNLSNTVASGVYFYRIEATSVSHPSKSFIQVKKMILLR